MELFKNRAVFAFFLIFFAIAPRSSQGNEQKITLQLAWKHQFQFAGYYAALAKGFYQEAGLEVEIREGGEGRFAKEEVQTGQAQYGIAGSELLLYRNEGLDFVTLAAIFQHSPSVLLTRRDKGIHSLQELINKKVMLLPGKMDADILAVFDNEGISEKSFTRLDQSYDLNDLITGKTDAVSAYSTNEPYQLKQMGVEPAIIRPLTYGVDFYSDCLFTTTQEITDHPDRVEKFLAASLRGWQYAMDNKEEIIEILLRDYAVKKSIDHLRFEAAEMEKLIFPKLVEIGHMNTGRWQHIGNTFVNLGNLPANFSLKGFIYDPDPSPNFTNIYRLLVIILILLAVAGIFLLIIFNKRLNNSIRSRTEELIQSEQRFEGIFNAMSSGVIICREEKGTKNFVVTEINPVAIRYASFSKREEIIGHSLVKVFPGLLDVDIVALVEKVSITGEPIALPLAKYLHRSISIFIEGHFCKISNGNLVLIFNDITEKQRMLEQAHHSQKLEAIGTLAGGIAHDFNNILSAIMGFAELIKDSLHTDSQVRRDVDQIIGSAKRAADLVKQILTFSRHEKPELILIKPGAVVEEALGLLRATLPATIQIKHEIDPNCASIMADATQIHQIVMNLGANAAFSTREMGGVIDIDLKTVDIIKEKLPPTSELQSGRYVQLRVKDNGPGIAEEIKERIFEPYFTTKDIGEGSGMGLAVVSGIIHEHGGTIYVKSKVGAGSTFTVLFPVVARS